MFLKWKNLSSNLLLILVTCTSSEYVDRTLEPDAHGPKVTEAVISKLDRVFTDDREFLRRTAIMLAHKRTGFRGSKGNIWQISEELLEQTKNSDKFPQLHELHKIAADSFSIYWLDPENFTAADLNKPLYSGLAVRFLLALEDPKAYRKYEPFEKQAEYWEKYYSITLSPEDLSQLRKDCKVQTCSKPHNMCIMLDRSGSIDKAIYSTFLKFVYDLVDETKSAQVRTAFLVFSDNVTLVSSFNATPEELQKAIMDPSKTLFPKGKTCTSSAILHCVEAFRSSHLLAQGALNINLLLTDGESSGSACPVKLDKAVEQVLQAKITSFVVGIGPAPEHAELEHIANKRKDHLFSTTRADDLKDTLAKIIQSACKEPVTLELNRIVHSFLQKDETQFTQIELLEGDMMEIALNVEEGEPEGYYSCDEPNPSSAVHDGKIVNGHARIQCPPSRQRRDVSSSQKIRNRKMVFLSITGLAERNVYTLTATAIPQHVTEYYFNSDWFAKSPHVSFRIHNHDGVATSGCTYVLAHWMVSLVLFLMAACSLLAV